jgi:uncharacterized membrane protein YhaH (DUF805 family)
VDGRIGWTDLFWSASGRLARTPFLVGCAILIAVAAIYEAWVGATLHWLTGWLVYPALLYSGACVLSKRLHDRGRSGWWASLLLVAVMMTWPEARGVRAVLALPVWIWGVVELGVLAGEEGANRFGPSPLAPAHA